MRASKVIRICTVAHRRHVFLLIILVLVILCQSQSGRAIGLDLHTAAVKLSQSHRHTRTQTQTRTQHDGDNSSATQRQAPVVASPGATLLSAKTPAALTQSSSILQSSSSLPLLSASSIFSSSSLPPRVSLSSHLPSSTTTSTLPPSDSLHTPTASSIASAAALVRATQSSQDALEHASLQLAPNEHALGISASSPTQTSSFSSDIPTVSDIVASLVPSRSFHSESSLGSESTESTTFSQWEALYGGEFSQPVFESSEDMWADEQALESQQRLLGGSPDFDAAMRAMDRQLAALTKRMPQTPTNSACFVSISSLSLPSPSPSLPPPLPDSFSSFFFLLLSSSFFLFLLLRRLLSSSSPSSFFASPLSFAPFTLLSLISRLSPSRPEGRQDGSFGVESFRPHHANAGGCARQASAIQSQLGQRHQTLCRHV